MKVKGFIGPIGDDLPSLIPLVFALIIFFSTFNFALRTFDIKQNDFESDLALVQISNNLKGTGVIANFAEFEKICNGLNVRGLKYYGAIIETSVVTSQSGENFLLNLKANRYVNTEGIFECTNLKDTDTFPTAEKLSEPGFALTSRIYPVILQKDETTPPPDSVKVIKATPMVLVLVVWKA